MVRDYGFPYNLVCYRKYQAEIVKGPMVSDYGFPHNLICYKKYKYEIMVGSMVSDYEASGGLVYAREIRLQGGGDFLLKFENPSPLDKYNGEEYCVIN